MHERFRLTAQISGNKLKYRSTISAHVKLALAVWITVVDPAKVVTNAKSKQYAGTRKEVFELLRRAVLD